MVLFFLLFNRNNCQTWWVEKDSTDELAFKLLCTEFFPMEEQNISVYHSIGNRIFGTMAFFSGCIGVVALMLFIPVVFSWKFFSRLHEFLWSRERNIILPSGTYEFEYEDASVDSGYLLGGARQSHHHHHHHNHSVRSFGSDHSS